MTDSSAPTNQQTATPSSTDANSMNKNWLVAPLVTLAIVLVGVVLVALFRTDINDYGVSLLTRFGQDWVDVILFLVTAVSCTPIMLPVWGYAVAGAALGLSVVRLAAVMALGSALGSYTTFAIGRYMGDRSWVKRRFPDLQKNPWTYGKSRLYVTMILFFGTASPLPCDVIYAACGAKRYPSLPFFITIVAARFVRYLYMGYGFLYVSDFF
ncbi:MAG: VTT domain-containing protein [candidate division Zixibacteria bacterium]|nr:VTT domain-containing protein [candidate division Zixibacteria bacterium]MDH3938681.1 VTT domain-containing protein [candidate division Zixibacteria bacterium]MDH4035800.1 VTT domain-containing protein [candidate division Zixibacteria bacterium]